MNLSGEDKQLLDELCRQNSVSRDKVLKLLQTVYDYEFKERRTGVSSLKPCILYILSTVDISTDELPYAMLSGEKAMYSVQSQGYDR